MAPPKGHNIPAVMVVSLTAETTGRLCSNYLDNRCRHQTVNTKAKTLERGHKR